MSEDHVNVNLDMSLGRDHYALDFQPSPLYQRFLSSQEWSDSTSQVLGVSLGEKVYDIVDDLNITSDGLHLNRPLYRKVGDDLGIYEHDINKKSFEDGFVDFKLSGLLDKEEEDANLEPAERAVLNALNAVENQEEYNGYVNASELASEVSDIEGFDYTGNRGWISNQLNNLVRKGVIGKFREGRTVEFSSDRYESVKNAIRTSDLSSGEKIELLDGAADQMQIEDFARTTEMPERIVEEYFELEDEAWKELNS